jgi:ParB family transcriptional regulator, chromosome partitioning protein
MDIPQNTATKLATLPLRTIDIEDRTFQVSSERNTADLAKSIALMGLIHLPRVIGVADGWRIVCGFRRIAACSALKWNAVQVWCLPQQTTALTCACLAIADNALQRSLTLPEQIRASRLLLDHFGDAANHGDDVSHLKTVAQAVGLPPNLKLLRKMKVLADAPAGLSQALEAGSIQFPMALELLKRPQPEATALAELFQMLRPSLNRQRELLSFVDDIAHRDEVPVEQIIGEVVSITDAANPNQERSVRYTRLRSALRSRRYPSIVKAEAQRAEALHDIRLEPHMQLLPPTNFEGHHYRLALRFSDLSELEVQTKCLSDLLKDPLLAKLLS